MIIKSMSRKEATFAQLYDYITREGDHDARFTYTQNFILKDRDEILREFERNAELLSKRKNGNYLYHEVISISRAKQISEQRQKELLQDIITQYAKSRGKDCLVFGGLHDEKDNNLHYHLMISANNYNQNRRYSLKKASFSKIKKQTELYVLERYPELEQAKLISKEITIGKTSNKEEELKRRTGKPSQKDVFRARLTEIFAISVDKSDFFDNLEKADIEIYTRGKAIGFVERKTNRKHRLKTLGLEAEFEAVNNTISQAEKTEKGPSETDTTNADISHSREQKSPEKSETISKESSKKREVKQKPQTEEETGTPQQQKPTDQESKTVAGNRKRSIKDAVKETAKEWIFGDFSDREERSEAQTEDAKKNKEQDEKLRATKKEVFGDDRGKQARREQIQKTREQQQKQNEKSRDKGRSR